MSLFLPGQHPFPQKTCMHDIVRIILSVAREQVASIDENEEEDIPYGDYSSDEYGTPLPANFGAYDSARQPSVSNPPPDLLRQKEFYLSPMSLTEAILSVQSPWLLFKVLECHAAAFRLCLGCCVDVGDLRACMSLHLSGCTATAV